MSLYVLGQMPAPETAKQQTGEAYMEGHSRFVADCLCGRRFETPDREYVCPACGRRIVLEWGGDAEGEGRRSEKKVFVPEAAQ
jgi:hypothetical protein